MNTPDAIAVLRDMERAERQGAVSMFQSRHDGMFELAIKVDVIRQNRKRAEVFRMARAALGDSAPIDPDDLDLYREAERVMFRGKRWGRDFEP